MPYPNIALMIAQQQKQRMASSRDPLARRLRVEQAQRLGPKNPGMDVQQMPIEQNPGMDVQQMPMVPQNLGMDVQQMPVGPKNLGMGVEEMPLLPYYRSYREREGLNAVSYPQWMQRLKASQGGTKATPPEPKRPSPELLRAATTGAPSFPDMGMFSLPRILMGG